MTEIKFVPTCWTPCLLTCLECETRHIGTEDSLEEREDEEEEEWKEPGMYDDAEEEVNIDGRE
jgi:hypothetical protein